MKCAILGSIIFLISVGNQFSLAVSPQPVDSNTSAKSSDFTAFQNQCQFIVDSIVTDLAKEIFYAKYQSPPDTNFFRVEVLEKSDSSAEKPAYDIQIDFGPPQLSRFKATLEIGGPLWSPAVYQNLTKSIAESVGLKPSKSHSKDDPALLADLLDATAVTIETQNQNISKSLKNDFSDPRLHEKAAVLIAAFALRDNSGTFFDIASSLCRLTTHLCMARYLSGSSSFETNGMVAEAALFTLMNCEKAAGEKINNLQANNAAIVEWRRVLETYNTHDYRKLAGREDIPLAGRIAWFEAFSQAVNGDLAWRQISERDKSIPDFARIAWNSGRSVELGHELSRNAISSETKEISAVYGLYFSRNMTRDILINALNQLPENSCINGGEINVIPWGHWAFFFQRHLCNALGNEYYFISEQWGVPEAANEFLTKSKDQLGKLRLFPFVSQFCLHIPFQNYKPDVEAYNVIEKTPQFTPGGCWHLLHLEMVGPFKYLTNSDRTITTVPLGPQAFVDQWYRHCPLPGTVYDPDSIISNGPGYSKAFLPTLDQLHEMAPSNRKILNHIVSFQYDDQPTYEQACRLYQSVISYDANAMATVANSITNQPDKYEQLMAAAAELNPSYYSSLGDYFRELANDDKAALYYEKGIQKNPDAVANSYFASWLASYYLKRGDVNKAEILVNAAAETFSYAGLQAKADFFSITGKKAEAAEWRKKIVERYGHADEFVQYPVHFQSATSSLQPTNSPSGITPQPKSQLSPELRFIGSKIAPTNGVIVNSPHAGIKTGDIIVSVDQYLVNDSQSFEEFVARTNSNGMYLEIWRDNRYVSIFVRREPLSVSNYSLIETKAR